MFAQVIIFSLKPKSKLTQSCAVEQQLICCSLNLLVILTAHAIASDVLLKRSTEMLFLKAFSSVETLFY